MSKLDDLEVRLKLVERVYFIGLAEQIKERLESLGVGSEESVNGADLVDAANEILQEINEALEDIKT